MARSLLAVPGLAETTDGFRRALLELANRHGWDADALATVISLESGFKAGAKNPLPNQTAVGILQFTAATLASLGWKGTRDEFARLSAVAQLPFVERYFVNAERSGKLERPVDFYLAVLGEKPGLALEHVLYARDGVRPQTYELNKSLDADGDGVIEVRDLVRRMSAQASRAKGEELEVFPAVRGGIGGRVLLGAAALFVGVKLLRRRTA
jgi:hypothetical protein